MIGIVIRVTKIHIWRSGILGVWLALFGGKKAFNQLDLTRAQHARQAVEKHLAIGFSNQARIAQDHHPTIIYIADQTDLLWK